MERGIDSGSLWLGDRSPLAHRRITRSIKRDPRIASGSLQGAERDHSWIVCLSKTIRNPTRYGRRAPYDIGKRRRPMHMEVNQSELNYNVERSSIDHLVPGSGPGEPYAVQADPYLDPWITGDPVWVLTRCVVGFVREGDGLHLARITKSPNSCSHR